MSGLLEILYAVKFFYTIPGNELGGLLQPMLERGALEDKDILVCIERANQAEDVEASMLADILLAMDLKDRQELYSYKFDYSPDHGWRDIPSHIPR